MCHHFDAMAAPTVSRRFVRIGMIAALALAVSAGAAAQFGRDLFGVRVARPDDFDGKFHFCRLVYQLSNNGRGGSWRTDWPNADINMSIRLAELTKTNVSFGARRSPNPILV